VKAAALVERLRAQGAELWAEGDRLRFRIPGQVLTDDLKAELSARKTELLALLSGSAGEQGAGESLTKGSSPRPARENTRCLREPAPDALEALRKLCPALWREVKTRDGRVAILWGVSAHGAAVSFDPRGPVYTLSALDVELG
jgi:hypothetical protein